MANKNDPSRIASNVYQIGNSKFMIVISFWFVLLFEGIFSCYYCDILNGSLLMWSNSSYGSPTGCYASELFDSSGTAYTQTLNGMTLIELSEQCITDGEILIVISCIGIIITFGIFAK